MNEVKEKQEITANEEKKKNIIEIPIKHPIEIDNGPDRVLINSITLDFSKLTGVDILQIDEQLRLEGKLFDHLYNQRVLLMLASRAANMKMEDLQKLHVADYLEVVFQTRNFFIQW